MKLKCEQKLCTFFKKGCKKCDSCGSKPHEVDEKCERCFACEYKQGSIRWGDEEQKEENKLIEVIVK